ncbi:MAG: hypothetical protein HFH45_01355 [Bacilli bacterium]|jgi:hypothetical protein|nr:hypothetical protein [Bacilli bacterium]
MNGITAQSDVGITLYAKKNGNYAELIEIKSVPASGQAGGTLETTTLKSPTKTYIPDRPDNGDMDYTYNYTEANYTAISAICDGSEQELLVKYQDGSGFTYKGQCQTWINEVSVGSVVEATLHTVPSVSPAIKTASEITTLLTAN